MSSLVAAIHKNNAGSPVKASVREAKLGDYRHIAKLLSENGLETKSFEEWRDLWIANPIYRERQERWPIGWVLETEGMELVGFLGNIPLAYVLDGEPLIAAATHAWAVDSRYRSYALLLLDHYFSQSNVDLYLSTTVNALASQAFTSFGSQRVPVGAWDTSLFWIGHYRGFAQSWLRMKRRACPRSISAIFAAVLWSKTRKARRAIDRTKTSQVELCAGFDNRFSVFWEALQDEQKQFLLAIRTREVLNWHFAHAGLQQKLYILAVCRKCSLLSYAIFLRQDNARYGLKRIRLVDFQTLKTDTSDLVPMLAWAAGYCRERKIDMLECVDWGVSTAVTSLAPAQRRLPCWLYYYKTKSRSLARALANPNVWKPTAFDGDSSL